SIDWTATPGWVGIVPNVNTPIVNNVAQWYNGPVRDFAIRYQGTIDIPSAGTWTFYTSSDDGSILYINGTAVVNNDGGHSQQLASGTITLPAGSADFDLKYYQNGGNSIVQAFWSGPGVASQTLIPASAFTCTPAIAIPSAVGVTSITLNGNSNTYVDAFNAVQGAYGGSNVITSGFATMTNATASNSLYVKKATLYGDAVCGPGGTPSTAIVTGASGFITGSKTAATSGIGVMAMAVTPTMPASSGAFTGTGTQTISSNKRYSTFTLSAVNAVVNISGTVVIQCDGDFTMDQNAAINIQSNSSLWLYIGGAFSMSRTSSINANTGDPRVVKIFMTGSAKDMTLNNSASCCAQAIDPSGTLNILGGGTPAPAFYGVFHGAAINMQNNAKFHSDISYSDIVDKGDGSMSITSWSQIR
ncbi:MAG TPA: PA14 domain-containing protein, partial [Phycisphaerales bacterium]|nr:PA14 domain-containing protein [Phycisphaerales bacterium]